MSTQLDERTDTSEELQTEEPRFSHIIQGHDKTANARILEARIMGTPLTALCGHTWVPSHEPQKFPICPKCLEIFEFAQDMVS
jgi:hypothetical protein